jgi:hypothetical protein
MNCHILLEKKFFCFFQHKGGPLPKKINNFEAVFFCIFGPDNTLFILKNIIFAGNSTRALDWCINYYFLKKKFLIFLVRVFGYAEKKRKIFSFRQFIHQSKALVELIRTMLFLKLYIVSFALKRQKTEEKLTE